MTLMPRALIVTGIFLFIACSRKNNLLMGRVEALVGSHTVVVTDCYRTRVPQPQRQSGEAGDAVWRYTPCRDADIWIRGGQLSVNGKDYGRLNPTDGVLVDHGVVSIERRGAALQPPAPPPLISSTFANRRILRLRRSHSWRSASTRIKRCGRWYNRFISAFSHPDAA